MTVVIKKAAKTNPITAHTIDKFTPELSRLRARRVMRFAIKRTTL
jgi:hypothetical protein